MEKLLISGIAPGQGDLFRTLSAVATDPAKIRHRRPHVKAHHIQPKIAELKDFCDSVSQ